MTTTPATSDLERVHGAPGVQSTAPQDAGGTGQDTPADARTAGSPPTGAAPVSEPDRHRSAISPERVGRVAAAVEDWIDQLIDLGGGNRLLHYRDLAVGTLDLGEREDENEGDDADADAAPRVNAAALEQLRGGRRTRLRTLFHDAGELASAARRMRAIAAKALENDEERGVRTLYLALGMATWTTPGPAPAPAAPILLLPLSARRRDAAGEDFELDVDGDAELNPVLVHYLATQKGVVIDGDALLADAQPDGLGAPDPELLFDAVRKAAGDVSGFEIADRAVIANFSFAKLPMVRDLDGGVESLAGHDVIAAIAGDPGAQALLRGLRPDVAESLPDRVDPADEFLVLPADASQQHVINRVLAGEHVVIQGPPGTGKSQTIVNLIASLVARGRSVLFVAEKRAAIDAVVGRINRVGLGEIVLDLHRDTLSRSRVARSLATALHAARSSTGQDHALLHGNLLRQREALVAHDETMHRVHEPWDLSLYELQSRILAFPTDAHSTLRFPRAVLDRMDAPTLDRLADEIEEYIRLGGPSLAASGSPWATAKAASPEAAERARQWAEHLVPVAADVHARLEALNFETGLRAAQTLGEWRERIGLLRAATETLSRFDERVFAPGTELDALGHELAPAAGANVLTPLLDRSYRAALREARSLLRPGASPPPADLLNAVTAAADQRRRWAADSLDGTPPRAAPSLAAAERALGQLDECLDALSAFLWLDADGRTPAALVSWSVALAADSTTLFKLPRVGSIERSFADVGASSMLDLARSENLDATRAAACLRYVWHLSIYESLAPALLGGFDPEVHTERERQFRTLDLAHQHAAVDRVRRAVAERITEVRNRYPDQSQLIENQASRKRGHLPLRRLFQQTPDVLTALQPCWTMSPLLVSQLLPSDQPYFDVVIFDEASQVTPADAVPALARGRQVVVAGDSHQLPPTRFFATDTAADRVEPDAGDDPDGEPLAVTTPGLPADPDADEAFAPEAAAPVPPAPAGPELDLGLTRGYESVLDVVAALLRPGHLLWHYRSRDERLIAFSNEHVYDGQLTTFPGTGIGGGVRLELVDPRATTEVDRVVDLVIQHARSRPGESLGVITMGIAHAERVAEALRLRLAAGEAADAAAFFDESAPERFFVKNLERVQGDERDAVILTVGYAKGADGRLRYRFGPLLQAGGERRLNVAVTRARHRLTVVSTFSHLDMDPDRSRAPGVRLLRAYLEYAARSGALPSEAPVGSSPADEAGLDPFQRYVRDWLVAAGAPVRTRYGTSGYRLDFALGHPDDPGRPVLAVESDGPMYHASRTARDRDRLRQEVLEQLGWRFHRIWSTAFYRDPHGETARVAAAWKDAVAAFDAGAATPPPAPAPTNGDAARDGDGAGEGDGRTALKPVAGDGRPITSYRDTELVALIRWIESDTLLRTDQELLEDAVRELGYSRQGTRISERLRRAILMVRAAS